MTATRSPLASAWQDAKAQAIKAAQFLRPMPDLAYQRDPVGWAVAVLGIPEHTIRWSLNPEYAEHKWDGTPDPLAAMAEALARGENVAVESGTTTGKTFTTGWLPLWWVACHKPALVVTTAPIENQLTLQLWKELGGQWRRFKRAYPTAETVKLRVRMDPNADEEDLDAIAADAWAVVGYACGVEANKESATRAQGFHNANMLIVMEEMPGIVAPVAKAFRATSKGAHNLRLGVGNPDHQFDTLHQFSLEPNVTPIRVSALDHPNVVCGRDVIPGAVTRESIEVDRMAFGEEHFMFKSRVRGISPSQSKDALIALDWVLAAQQRYLAARTTQAWLTTGTWALGVDVANSEAGDEGAIARGKGRVCVEVETFACPNANDLGIRVVAEMQVRHIDDAQVGIDGVGVGAGCVNECRRHDRWIRSLQGGPIGALDEEKFLTLRQQMYWQAREDLRQGLCDLPPDAELARDLTIVTWQPRNGKIIVESKEDLKKRLGRSPNKGDAFVYWNWVRDRSAGANLPVAPTAPSRHQMEQAAIAALDRPLQPTDYAVIRQ